MNLKLWSQWNLVKYGSNPMEHDTKSITDLRDSLIASAQLLPCKHKW